MSTDLELDPGDLKCAVTFSIPSSIGDEFGSAGTTWTTVLTTYASLEQTAARSVYQTGALSTQVSHKLRMHYRSGITINSTCRMTYGAHTYRVINVDDILERHLVYELLLLEVGGSD